MKKFTLLLLLCSTFFFAQERVEKFESTPEGFPNYVVLEFPASSASEIFKQVKNWAQYNIRNSKKAKYSEVQNEYIAYSLFVERAFEVDAFYGVDYDLEIRIKDEKLRIDLIIKSMPLDVASTGVDLTFSKGLNSMFKNNGEPRTLKDRQLKREAIESFANDIVSTINDAVLGKTDAKNDW